MQSKGVQPHAVRRPSGLESAQPSSGFSVPSLVLACDKTSETRCWHAIREDCTVLPRQRDCVTVSLPAGGCPTPNRSAAPARQGRRLPDRGSRASWLRSGTAEDTLGGRGKSIGRFSAERQSSDDTFVISVRHLRGMFCYRFPRPTGVTARSWSPKPAAGSIIDICSTRCYTIT